jgi:hypothetical protein
VDIAGSFLVLLPELNIHRGSLKAKKSITGRLISCKSNCHTFKRKGKCMSQEEEKKNNTTFWIVMIILLVLVIVGGAYVRWQFWTG